MKLNFIVRPMISFLLCRDSLDCPKNHVCVHNVFMNFCKKVEPNYRPRLVPISIQQCRFLTLDVKTPDNVNTIVSNPMIKT